MPWGGYISGSERGGRSWRGPNLGGRYRLRNENVIDLNGFLNSTEFPGAIASILSTLLTTLFTILLGGFFGTIPPA